MALDVESVWTSSLLAQLVLLRLNPNQAQRAAQVCRPWREAAAEDWIWNQFAKQLYPEATLTMGTSYTTYRELVRDDNSRNAVSALDWPTTASSSTWKHNHSEMHYECLLHGCELSREHLRVAFDARGEWDLRHPSSSTLALEVMMPTPAAAPSTAVGGSSTQPTAPSTAVGGPPAVLPAVISRYECVGSVTPTRELMYDGQQAHYKGMLEWDQAALQSLQAVAANLDQGGVSAPQGTTSSSVSAPQEATTSTSQEGEASAGATATTTTSGQAACAGGRAPSWRLVFYYACDPIRSIQQDVDYLPVILLEEEGRPGPMPGDSSPTSWLMRAWRRKAHYQAQGALQSTLSQQTDESDRALWQAQLPAYLNERLPEWWTRTAALRTADNPPRWRKVRRDAEAWLLGHEWVMDALVINAEAQPGAGEQQEEDQDGGAQDQAWEWELAHAVGHSSDEEEA